MTTASPSIRPSGDQITPGKEISREKCGQQASGSAAGRWRRQHKTEQDGDEWSVVYDTLGVTRLYKAK